MKFDIASEMDGILKSPEHINIFAKPVVKTASVKKQASAYEQCLNTLVRLSAFFDNAGLEKSAAFTILALDAMVNDSQACNNLDSNDIDVQEYLSMVPDEELETDPNFTKHSPEHLEKFVDEIESLPSTTKSVAPPSHKLTDIIGPNVEKAEVFADPEEIYKDLIDVKAELNSILTSFGAKKDPAKEKAKAQAAKEKAKAKADKEKAKAQADKNDAKAKAKSDKEKAKAKADKEKAKSECCKSNKPKFVLFKKKVK
jgi:uncharacterized protein YqfA (UPF0365 family)